MEPSTSPLSIRLPADLKSWLTVRAEANRSSLNSEIVEVLSAAMKAKPNYIVIYRCKTSRMGEFFCAAWNESADDFYSGDHGQGKRRRSPQ